ncbi:NUDIX domain-containing protein [Fluviibacterium sp. S390]|uniref:NUDIX domain-containing protein n=1 Tax=Fluviibacterium sp. S390 TaxID=3415139 RepID=UPI003C7AC5B6
MSGLNRFLDQIRPTVRAVIRRDGRLLVQVKQKSGKPPYLTLPGGRQDPGETMEAAVARECLEEIGAEVAVGPLLHVADVFKPKHGKLRHQIEVLFACEVAANYIPRLGPQPDKSQIATIWVSPDDPVRAFHPNYGTALSDSAAPLYLGRLDG